MPSRSLRRLPVLPTILTAALACLVVATVHDDASAQSRPSPSGRSSFEQRLEAWQTHRALEASSPFRHLPWRPVGPIVQGGRVVDIEAPPNHPYRFYVAYASGGLWVTHNNGRTFEPLFDRQPTIVMGDLAIDPQAPDTLWVGTGENNSSRSSYGGFGMFRSTDGGQNWEHRGLGETDRIGRVLIDPRDSNTVWVAALGSLYTKGGQRGVYKTTDGGDSWTQVLGSDFPMAGAIDMVMDPRDPDTVYVSLWDRSRRPWNFVEGGPGSGIWKTTDGGANWTRSQQGIPTHDKVGRIGLTQCLSSPDTLYAVVDNQELLPESEWDLGGTAVTVKRIRSMSKEDFLAQDPDEVERFIRASDFHPAVDAKTLIGRIERDEMTIADLIAEVDDANASLFQTDIRGLEVYRSDDAGGTWRKTHSDPILQVVHTYGYYFGQVRVAPDDPERIFVVGVPLVRSTDGGKTFRNVQTPEVHVDHHEVWIDPRHPQRVLLGNDGGLDLSHDGGETWLELDGPDVGQFYTIELDNQTPYRIYGGLQDNGTYVGSSQGRPGHDEWSFIGGGDGMYVQVDSRDGTRYLGYQFGFYMRIDPDGSRHDVRPRSALGSSNLRYNWATPIQLSSHNEDIVYFGANQLFRSMDQGTTWTAISPDLSRSNHRGDVPYATITTVAESTLEFGVLWAATDDGYVYVTEDGGKSWSSVVGGLPTDRWVSRVEPSSVERQRCYLSLNGYRDDDITPYLYVTEDLGVTWRSISKGLPTEAINVVREDPLVPNLLYVGTDRGVYVSLDRGASWTALPHELPNVPVHDLAVHPTERELVAGTHGRSVWVIDALPIQEAARGIDAAVEVFPLQSVEASRGWKSRRSQWFHREDDAPRVTVPYWSDSEGPATVEVRDEEQRVLWTRTIAAIQGANVFEWNLLLDPDLAVAAERAALSTDDTTDDTKGSLAKTPWAESVRLGHPLYVTAGDYDIVVTVGEESGQTTLTVEAPDAYEPRVKKPAKIRGEDDD